MSELTLTYDELSERLKRSPDATRQLVRRRRWRRMTGNDGKARVVVPVEELEAIRPPDVATTTGVDDVATLPGHTQDALPKPPPPPSEDARALIAVLESRISELQGRVTELADELKEARPRSARLDTLEALLAAERGHAADLKAERDKLLERVMTPERPGFFDRLRRAIGG